MFRRRNGAILYSLLAEEGHHSQIEKVRAIVNSAKRNALVHGILSSEDDLSKFAFLKRDVGSSYQVKPTYFTADTFHDHFQGFRKLYIEAMSAIGINLGHLEEYGKRARLFEEEP